MMDRFEAMTLFLAAVDEGSLSAAARALAVPVATLSRKVAALEQRLGTPLLARTTRQLGLTEAGLAYAAAARRILEQVDEAERNAGGEFLVPRGDLVITAPLLFGRLHLLPLVTEFLAQYPDINIRLVLGDSNADLVGEHIDMALRIGALPDSSSLIATRIGALRVVTCASPALLDRLRRPERPEDLVGLPSIAAAVPRASLRWRFRDPADGAMIDVAVRPRLITTAEATADAAMAGAGFARLLHYQAIGGLRRGALSLVLEAYERAPVPVHLVHAARGQMPLKMRRFLDFAAPRLRLVLADIAAA